MSASDPITASDPNTARTADLDRRAHVLARSIAVVSVAACAIFAVVGALARSTGLLAFFGVYLLVYGSVWLLLRRDLDRAAAWLLFLAVDSGIAILSCLLGPGSLIQVMFLLVPVMALFLAPHEPPKLRALMLVVGPATLVLLELRGYDLVPALALGPTLTEAVRWPLILIAFGVNLLMLQGYTRDRDRRFEIEGFLMEERALTQRLELAHAAARAAEDRLRLVIEQMPSGLVVVREGRVIFANRVALALLDPWTTLASPADLSLEAAVSEPDRDRLARELAEARNVPFELRVRRTDGGEALLEAVASRLPGQPERYLALRDLTAERQVEAERRGLEDNLRQTQKLESLGVLAGGIAHDFNNLLTGILGNASVAAGLLTPGSEAASCLGEIEAASKSAGDLCRQLLAYSGRGTLSADAVDLSALVGETTRLLALSIRNNARLELELARGLPAVVVDPTQVRQVAMNLVMNASDALRERGGAVRVRTSAVQADAALFARCHLAPELPAGTYVCLEVSDDGCGMSPEAQRRLFEPFYSTKATGRGLGLAAVLGIVRGHKSAVLVESEVGRGTTFRIYFPAAGAPAEAPAPAPAAPAKGAWQGKVLVVDDDERVRRVTTRSLTRLGFEVATAVDGVEGVDAVRASPGVFRLVVLDSAMPRMNGREALTELRRLHADLPVLVVSGFDGSDVLGGFAADPCTRFLQKPFSAQGLEDAVAKLVPR